MAAEPVLEDAGCCLGSINIKLFCVPQIHTKKSLLCSHDINFSESTDLPDISSPLLS